MLLLAIRNDSLARPRSQVSPMTLCRSRCSRESPTRY